MQQFGNGGTFFRLSVRSGRDIGPLSLFPENELLLLPNTVFEVQTALSSREVRKNSARPVTRATGRIEVTPWGHASNFTIDQTLLNATYSSCCLHEPPRTLEAAQWPFVPWCYRCHSTTTVGRLTAAIDRCH